MGASKNNGNNSSHNKINSHKTEIDDKEDKKVQIKKQNQKIFKDPKGFFTDEEIKEMGFPTEFTSSKGKQVQKNPVEAIRIGQIRQYQRYSRKKMRKWQIERLNKKVQNSKNEQ